ncbi:DNA repair protein RecN [Roseivirga sp. E12]|uniref:DNA repair protein RecN n=1 Tax=Roseivirga sp. E12 TaxID=2819237 RepID=UPI001ABD2BDA|nr:DNA repair protein RecN [Roseivirga sp. E12]MBO3700469.1 DNA repair protein RecN [Roseivirga sp. E12]
MLKSLSIENYALIKHLQIEPDEALNIVTGETGAGKSIMLGALGLLLGNRADTKVLLEQDRKCVIEGIFDISAYSLKPLFETFDIDFDEECIVRREISTSGKSRAFVNDGVTNLDFLKQLGLRLMDVHSQHETLRLANKDYQLEIIDAVASSADVLNEFQMAYKSYQEKHGIYQSLITEGDQIKKESDYNQFLFEELDKAQLDAEEQDLLEIELSKLENSEEIKTKLNSALEISDRSEINLTSMLQEVRSMISQISQFSPKYAELLDRIESARIELKDIVGELEIDEENVVYDPNRADEVQERLNLIYKLQQKHQVDSIEALLVIYNELGDKVLKVENLDEAIEEAHKAEQAAYQKALKLAESLSKKRQAVFSDFGQKVESLLSELGMPNATISMDHSVIDLSANGIDQIDILFSANKGIAPQALKQAASGGEFSRLMFSIKYILADKTALPTIVFDEIDTGISGEIAIKMSQMMLEMAKNHQVITITHLPQIAAKGQSHYFVYKDESSNVTTSKIRKLSEDERLNEIAEMIGGKQASANAYDSAKELMKG